MTDTSDAIIEAFMRHQNPEKAGPMQRYMKTEQPFFGIQKPLRAQLIRDELRRHPVEDPEGYRSTVQTLWRDSRRESQYAAIDIAMHYIRWRTDEHWDLYRVLVHTATWWDTLDSIATNLIGPCLLKNREHQIELDEWATWKSVWVRRAALLAHLKHNREADLEAIERTILTLTADRQFFIQKSIGWVLREYSKTNADWVRLFIEQHRSQFSNLAIREGSKYL